jgi:hypothetical protein
MEKSSLQSDWILLTWQIKKSAVNLSDKNSNLSKKITLTLILNGICLFFTLFFCRDPIFNVQLLHAVPNKQQQTEQ